MVKTASQPPGMMERGSAAPDGQSSQQRSFDPESINQKAFDYYSRLRRIRAYVESHPDEAIPVRQAARISGMSETYFSSFFHQKVGVKFRDWRAHQKIVLAVQLLEARNRTITEVAMETGFGDLRTFQRTFKRHTGLTPRQYKRVVSP